MKPFAKITIIAAALAGLTAITGCASTNERMARYQKYPACSPEMTAYFKDRMQAVADDWNARYGFGHPSQAMSVYTVRSHKIYGAARIYDTQYAGYIPDSTVPFTNKDVAQRATGEFPNKYHCMPLSESYIINRLGGYGAVGSKSVNPALAQQQFTHF